MSVVQPQELKRRSMLYRKSAQAQASFESVADGAAAMRYSDSDEIVHARRMGVADLTTIPRIGFKGKDTPAWLEENGLQLPKEPNRVTRQTDGALVARLSIDEHLVLEDLETRSEMVARLDSQWRLQPGRMCYKLLRDHSHCWLLLTGEATSSMLAKVCGVDMRPKAFPDGWIAQTSMARINAIVIRSDLGGTRAFHVLADSASAEYLWFCLHDAMAEFAGCAVGLAALRALANDSTAK